jgi:hypothetical protein
VDGVYSTGCECQDNGFGKSCNTSTGLGTIPLGAQTQVSGNLPLAGEEAWFQVTFAYTTATTYHPRISLTANPGNAFRFDVLTSCAFGSLACADGGISTGRTDWEVFGGGQPTGFSYAPTPAVPTVFVRVLRANGAITCSPFTLTVSN